MFSFVFPNYIDIQVASFSYTIGGSYGSCVKFKKSQYNFSDFDTCSCAWAANTSYYSDCYELYYNPQTKVIKYNLLEGGEYIFRNFSSDYTCHMYNEENQELECLEMDQSECTENTDCNWEEDIEWGYCGNLNPYWNNGVPYCNDSSVTTDQCYTYTCYGGTYGSWSTCCTGANYIIDNNSYCEEIDSLIGDMNEDGILNVIDLVMIVDLILNSEYEENSDMNEDGILNILDVVSLVDLIIS